MKEMPKQKTQEELKKQINLVEKDLNKSIIPESTTKEEILSMPVDEIKEKYPEEYGEYLTSLKKISKEFVFSKDTVKAEYTNEELEQIHQNIISKGKFQIEPELIEKLTKDGALEELSLPIIFFPEIYERIYNKNEKPIIEQLPTSGREIGFKVIFKDKAYVIKMLESKKEKDIADKVSDLNIGPKQFKTLEGHLVEEFLEGDLLTKIDSKRCTPEFMKNIGIQLGEHLKTLHKNNILVNDQILSNDYSRSHLMITSDDKVKIIDFGASIDLTNFPEISDDEVFSLMRTDAMASMFISSLTSESQKKASIDGYRKKIIPLIENKETLIQIKDMQLMNEGFHFLGEQRLPNVKYLVEGFYESYNQN